MINITIDIGNTIISFCMFKKNKLLKHTKIPKDKLNLKTLKVLKEKFLINHKVKVLISSVVPKSEKIIKSFFRMSFCRRADPEYILIFRTFFIIT